MLILAVKSNKLMANLMENDMKRFLIFDIYFNNLGFEHFSFTFVTSSNTAHTLLDTQFGINENYTICDLVNCSFEGP